MSNPSAEQIPSADKGLLTETHYPWCSTCEERECAYPHLRHGLYCVDCGTPWPCETSKAIALLKRVLVEKRVRHDHAWAMEFGPHHCAGCDLEAAIRASVFPSAGT